MTTGALAITTIGLCVKVEMLLLNMLKPKVDHICLLTTNEAQDHYFFFKGAVLISGFCLLAIVLTIAFTRMICVLKK